MIELKSDRLVFKFPEVHPDAELRITFKRTLRIPDDDKVYPLPPGLGSFPLRHIDDFAQNISSDWLDHGGIMLPMYQSEALWIDFDSIYLNRHRTSYPFAVKIATGKINAISGKTWKDTLNNNPQDYVVVPKQPWIDGYCVKKGIIRQFVAMPLGSGYSAEEQITGHGEHGGLQVIVHPMDRNIFDKRFPERAPREELDMPKFCRSMSVCESSASDMGLAPGGRMKQEIYDDPFNFNDWDTEERNRCFVHIANSLVWRTITGETPPTVPFTSKEYTKAGFPWFDYYSDGSSALKGSGGLGNLKSVATLGQKKKDVPLPENESVLVDKIICLRKGLSKGQVFNANQN